MAAIDRLIFHVDVNSAFLSWEAARRVARGEDDLRLIPSAVGGNANSRRSIISAKSIPAKKYGITTGEPVSMALRKCPELVVVEPDFELYRKCSSDFISLCREYAPVLEQFSIDECFMDMTGTSLIYPDPVATAVTIKDRIKDTYGFTVNIGIGSNKLLAKMASDFEKPDKVHTLFSKDVPIKMWPLPVDDLLFCGKSAASRLKSARVRTIGDLAKCDLRYLKSLVGDNAAVFLHDYANGIDNSPVTEEREDAKSYGMSTTLEDDVVSFEVADKILLKLSDSVGRRMRNDGAKAYCIGVTIRSIDFRNKSHQRSLQNATDITSEIYDIAKELFREIWDAVTPLRLLNVTLSNITRDDFEQLSLFDGNSKQKYRNADKAMDSIRDRFGSDMIKRGSDLT